MFFSVAANQAEDYNPDDIIKFHHIFSNVNPGFPGWNPATNMFTCPYSGYYMFIVTLYKSDNDASYDYNIYAHLRRSAGGSYSDVLRLGNFNHNTQGVYFSSTMHAIVPCEQGQTVWVAMTATTSRRIFDNYSNCNQFSGLLIKEGLE